MKKSIWLRIALLALAALMLVSCFVACKKPDDPNNPNKPDNPDNPDNPDDPDDPTDVDYLLTLPKKDWGDTFTWLLETGAESAQIIKEEDAIETIDVAIYNRNTRVEEYLGCTIDYVSTNGGWSQQANYATYVRNSVSVSDYQFDALSVYGCLAAPMAVEGLFYNLLTLENMDVRNEWWAQGLVDCNIVYDGLYMITGDIALSMWQSMYALFFSKTLAENHGLTYLYQMVRDGDWTLENMMECASLVSVDNGDDKWDENDTYGLLLNCHCLRSWVTNFDIPVTTRQDDGSYKMTMQSKRTEDIYADIYNYLYGGTYAFIDSRPGMDGSVELILPMFKEDRGLFLNTTLWRANEMRDMETEYGILPMAKYDEDQEDYHTFVSDGSQMVAVPSTTEVPGFTGAVLEALGAEGKYSLVPTYYDVVLKGRSTKDDDSKEMIDRVRDAVTYEFGFTHMVSLGYPYSLFGDSLGRKSSTSFAPLYEGRSSVFEENMKKIMEGYAKLTE